MIRDQIGDNLEVEIIEGRLLVNTGKMTISENLSDKVTIKNMGKLVFEESVDIENLDKYIHAIENYGKITGPSKHIGILNKKAVKNYGKISETSLDTKKEVEDTKEKADIMYSNMGELKL